MEFGPVIDRRTFLRKAAAAGMAAIAGPPMVQSLLGFPAWGAGRGERDRQRTVTKTPRPGTVDKSARGLTSEKTTNRSRTVTKSFRPRVVEKTARSSSVSKAGRTPRTQTKP